MHKGGSREIQNRIPQADAMLALMELYNAGVDEIVKEHEEEHCSSFSFMEKQLLRFWRGIVL